MIKLYNLDPSLKQWIMTVTGLGPGIGDTFFVASASSNYYYWLRDDLKVDPYKLFTTVTEAENATTGSRNDCVLVMPAAYDEAASISWDKANTHLIGCGGPNTFGDYSEPNVVIYTDTTAVAEVINVTGANCQFINFTVANFGNNAGNLAALKLNKYGCYFRNVAFQGSATAGTDDVVAAASLYIAADGMYPVFERCVIGQNVWDVREGANSGVLRFTGTTVGPYGGEFRDCRFLSRSDTATVAMVALPANSCIGGTWLFDNCSFENFATNWAANLNQVFYANCGTTYGILLKGCSAIGIDEWQDADAGNNYIASTMPIVGTGGGLARNPTGTTGN